MSGTEKIIEIEGMTKRYGKHRGVEDLNLSVERGRYSGSWGRTGRGNPPPFGPCWD